MVYRRLAMVLPVVAALGSCATNHATGAPAFSLATPAFERDVGDSAALDAIRLNGLYKPESKLTKYVTGLCNKVYAVTEEAAKPLSCLVLDSETYNAWATPGYINVYRGMLPYIESEADVVAVIAHESGHLTSHHVGQKITVDMLTGIMALGVGAYVASESDDVDDVITGMELAGAAGQLGLAMYSRTAEREADMLSLRYMERLGYDKREAVTSMRTMQAKEAYDYQVAMAFNNGKPPAESLYDTLHASHPPTPERIADTLSMAGGEPDGGVKLPAGIKPATPATDPQGRNRYLNMIDGLEYGPRTKWGIAGRGYIALPSQRFLLNMPDGFVTDYRPSGRPRTMGQWVAAHPQTGVKMETRFFRYKGGLNVGHVLQDMVSGMDDGVKRMAIGSGENQQVAYTGVAKQWLGSERARLVAVPLPAKNAMMIVAFIYPDAATLAREDDTVMRELQKSRYLSKAQAEKLKPLSVRVFTAGVGDSLVRAAEKMPSGALRQEWFRALNRLAPTDELRVGRCYKTVIDPNNL